MIESRGAPWRTVHAHARVMLNDILNIKKRSELLQVVEETLYSLAQQAELLAFEIREQWRTCGSELSDCAAQRRMPRRRT
jgi:hypothetical protein